MEYPFVYISWVVQYIIYHVLRSSGGVQGVFTFVRDWVVEYCPS